MSVPNSTLEVNCTTAAIDATITALMHPDLSPAEAVATRQAIKDRVYGGHWGVLTTTPTTQRHSLRQAGVSTSSCTAV